MKLGCVLAFLLLSFTVKAQSTNAPASNPVRSEAQPQNLRNGFVLQQPGPNEVFSAKGKVSYSGVLVEAAKDRSLLQLFNPLTPPKEASPEQNLVRDPINGRATGLKFFAIRF